MASEPLYVASPYLPQKEEYYKYTSLIWETKQLTNQGYFVRQLEEALKNFLNVDSEVILTNNGTSALEVAIKALGDFEHFLTTPFSFLATLNALRWVGHNRISFIDIEPDTWNVNPALYERFLSENENTLSVFTHVFGNPCDHYSIKKVASHYDTSAVIYDAAHAFNVYSEDKSIFDCGDISTVSFHATKIFHTIEGGAIFCKDKELAEKMRAMINFGFVNGEPTHEGTNAKMSEFHAAMGLAVLNNYDDIELRYKENFSYLYKELSNVLQFQLIKNETKWNYSYCPVLLKSESSVLNVQQALHEKNIFPRRYFYPSLNTAYSNYRQACPISEDVSERVLCLPIHTGVEETDLATMVLEISKFC